MKHRSDYRIVKVHKKGYYTYYQPQERFLLFFWLDMGRCFDDIPSTKSWIDNQLVVEKREVVK